MTTPSLLEQLRSISRLMTNDGATVGERKAAQAMFDKLMTKHGLTPEDLIDKEHLVEFMIRTKGPFHQKMLINLVWQVVGTQDRIHVWKGAWRRKGGFAPSKVCITIEATKLEGELIKERWPIYSRALDKALDLAVTAVISKNEIYGTDGKSGGESSLSAEDMAMLRALYNNTRKEQIPSKAPRLNA